jgi:hypothetical protein
MAVKYSKFGIDANQPIDQAGNIAPRLQNPDYLANTGAHWVRLNFVLFNSSHLARYDQIVNGLLSRNFKIYATVGQDAVADIPMGDALRDSNSTTAATWIQRYAARVTQIVDRYRGKIFVYEAVNEPNGWHGGSKALVHPRWFAYLMNTLYQLIRPRERGMRLISGPLEATYVNNNEAAIYLNSVYRAGNWAAADVPWDGVGYHLYVGERPDDPPGSDGSARPEDIRQTYTLFLNQMWAVIQKYEPNTRKKLWVSEFGWASGNGEDFQARLIPVGMEMLAKDDRVAMASLFCAEDFGRLYGLYTPGLTRPKQAFHVFRNLLVTNAPNRSPVVDFNEIEGPVQPPEEPGESFPWPTGPGRMRHPVQERAVILLPPTDDGRWARAALAAGLTGPKGVTFTWSPGEAGLTIAGEKRLVLVINPAEWGTPDGSMVPWFRQNTPGVLVREQTFAAPDDFTAWLRSLSNPFEGAQ